MRRVIRTGVWGFVIAALVVVTLHDNHANAQSPAQKAAATKLKAQQDALKKQKEEAARKATDAKRLSDAQAALQKQQEEAARQAAEAKRAADARAAALKKQQEEAAHKAAEAKRIADAQAAAKRIQEEQAKKAAEAKRIADAQAAAKTLLKESATQKKPPVPTPAPISVQPKTGAGSTIPVNPVQPKINPQPAPKTAPAPAPVQPKTGPGSTIANPVQPKVSPPPAPKAAPTPIQPKTGPGSTIVNPAPQPIQINTRNLDGLESDFRARVENILRELTRQGWQPVVAEGRRTAAQQKAKFDAGVSRTLNSAHMHGLGADIIDQRYGWSIGQNHAFWLALRNAATAQGLTAGYDWNLPGIGRDVAHVEWTNWQARSQLKK
jgi:hypothetical protein